jgi:hypothetical protein
VQVVSKGPFRKLIQRLLDTSIANFSYRYTSQGVNRITCVIELVAQEVICFGNKIGCGGTGQQVYETVYGGGRLSV